MSTDKNAALVRAGIRPADWGMRKGTQTHKNARRDAQLGKLKHKNHRGWS